MSETKTPKNFALAFLALACLASAGPALAAPGDFLGGEFQVNTTTAGEQGNPALAMDADGDFVVAWQSCPLDGDGLIVQDGCDVFAQRYDAAGAPQGGEVLVNATTGQAQFLPAVAMADDGAFVVVWWGYGPGGGYGIFGRRYSAAGAPQGPEFQVSASETPSAPPSVAMNADGGFVVVWAAGGILGRRYNAAGEAQGGEFVVEPAGYYTSPKDPAVAMDAAGSFVVVWEHWRIRGRLYDAGGAARGDVFELSTAFSASDKAPAVAMDADGDFVAVWEAYGSSGEELGVFGRRFNAAGAPAAGMIQLGVGRPDVAKDADGDFVVTWTGYDLLGVWGVHGQRYGADGLFRGGEFQANASPTTTQVGPAVSMDADGDFVVAWMSDHVDGADIFAQRLDGAERVEGDFDGDGKADLLWRNATTGQTIVWLMDGETKLEAGAIGTVPTAWEIAGTGDFNGDGKADVLWRNSGTGTAVVWQMNGLEKAAAQSIGTVPLAWTVERLRDTNGDGLSDIVWRNTETGSTVVWRMSGFTRLASDAIGSVPSEWTLH